MPRLPSMAAPAMQDLARQLRFASPGAARRQMLRAEELAGQIEPTVEYPAEWIAFRVTGFRADLGESGVGGLVRGSDLLRDLSALVEGLSTTAGVTVQELDREGGWLAAPTLCERWSISRKSLERYRRMGLVARRAVGARGRAQLMFAEGAVAAFEREHGARLGRAGAVARIGAREREELIRRAARYERRLELSRGAVVARLAARFGRSREAVRRALAHGDPEDVGPGAGALELLRRVNAGASLTEIAEVLGASRGAAQHALLKARLERVRGIDISSVLAHAPEDDAEWEGLALRTGLARSGLGRPGPVTLAELFSEARRIVPDVRTERAWGRAYVALMQRAARTIAQLPDRGAPRSAAKTAALLDEAETSLRWAARVKAELIRSQLPLVVRTAEARLGAPLMGLPPRALADLFDLLIAAAAGATDRFDPFGEGRLAAPIGLALDRAAASWTREHPDLVVAAGAPGRAARQVDAALVPVSDFTGSVSAWQESLEPDRRVRAGAARLSAEARRVLELRFGWAGAPARTVQDVSAEVGVTPARVRALEQRGIREAVALADKEPA